jgi:ACR3 family arsenite transporter
MAAAGTTSPNPVQITNKSTMSADYNIDVEKQAPDSSSDKEQSSAFKALGWLDRLLALWILLAMIIGVLLGNFVPNTGPALQKGKFVGVSIPIGKGPSLHTFRSNTG